MRLRREYALAAGRGRPAGRVRGRVRAGAGSALPGRQLARPAAPVHRGPGRRGGGRGVGRRAGPVLVGLDLAGPADRRPHRRLAARRPAGRGGGRRLDLGEPLQAGLGGGGRAAGAVGGALDGGRVPHRPVRAAGAVRGPRADAAGRAGRHRRRACRCSRWSRRWTPSVAVVVLVARGVPVRRAARPAGDHRGRARGRRAGAVGPVPLRRVGAGRPRGRVGGPGRGLHVQVPQRRARRRRPTCTSASDLQSALRQPIQGWFGAADQFAMRPGVRARAGDRPVPGRDAAGARRWSRSRRACGCWPRPGSTGCGPRGRR